MYYVNLYVLAVVQFMAHYFLFAYCCSENKHLTSVSICRCHCSQCSVTQNPAARGTKLPLVPFMNKYFVAFLAIIIVSALRLLLMISLPVTDDGLNKQRKVFNFLAMLERTKFYYFEEILKFPV